MVAYIRTIQSENHGGTMDRQVLTSTLCKNLDKILLEDLNEVFRAMEIHPLSRDIIRLKSTSNP